MHGGMHCCCRVAVANLTAAMGKLDAAGAGEVDVEVLMAALTCSTEVGRLVCFVLEPFPYVETLLYFDLGWAISRAPCKTLPCM